MHVVVEVKIVEPYVLEVKFADSVCRRVDVEPVLYGEMFEFLRDPELFRQASLDPELGTVVWPNGADFSLEFLYQVEGEAISGRGGRE